MATDIAFAIGILVMLSWRVPRNLVVFLTALAIADDLGAVLVIAVFYTSSLDTPALVAVAVLSGMLALLNRGGVRNLLPYGFVGILLWYAMWRSGIHATVAGILLAFAIPARPARTPAEHEARMDELHAAFTADRRDLSTPDDPLRNERMVSIASAMERSARKVQSPLQRLEHALAPRITFIVVPLFALANAGIDLGAIEWSSALTQRSTLGIVLGLVLGKFIGISLFCWVAIRLGVARLPTGVEWNHLLGAAWLAGIGFTMSLFIAQLAFTDPRMVDSAKLGILVASALAAAIGVGWLVATARKP